MAAEDQIQQPEETTHFPRRLGGSYWEAAQATSQVPLTGTQSSTLQLQLAAGAASVPFTSTECTAPGHAWRIKLSLVETVDACLMDFAGLAQTSLSHAYVHTVPDEIRYYTYLKAINV